MRMNCFDESAEKECGSGVAYAKQVQGSQCSASTRGAARSRPFLRSDRQVRSRDPPSTLWPTRPSQDVHEDDEQRSEWHRKGMAGPPATVGPKLPTQDRRLATRTTEGFRLDNACPCASLHTISASGWPGTPGRALPEPANCRPGDARWDAKP